MDESEFLKRKGSIEILCELESGEKGFTELKNLDISPSTLSARLKEAMDLGLVDQKLCREERAKIKYYLTEKGREVMKMVESIKKDYFRLKEEAKRLEEEAKKKRQEIEEILEKLR
ncbi:hypothetical protein DRP04_10645 [Archaeoglobales archaeon]|nr:MAG: hypothetical protein DRP04_10645 [Archaeoglobales archaeon]